MAAAAAKTAEKQSASLKLVVGSKAKEDSFVSVAKEVETLTEKQAFNLAHQLVTEGEQNSFKLGGVLAKIQESEWLGDHPDFRTLVETEFGLQYRKAAYLITIYTSLVNNNIPWSKVKHVGWTKLRVLARVLTEKNYESWITKAEKKTVNQLEEMVKKALAKSSAGDAEDGGESVISTMTFKLHPDQKKAVTAALKKAKKETKTDVDTVALSNIMTAYNGGSVEIPIDGETLPEAEKDKIALLDTLIGDLGYEVALTRVEKLFPKLDIKVALAPAKKKAA